MLRNLFKKSLFYFGTLVGGKLLTAIFFIFLARALQPEKFGEITLFITIVQIIAVITDLGLKSWYQKTAANNRDPALLTKLTRTRVLLYVASVVILALGNWLYPLINPDLMFFIYWALFLETFLTVADSYYLAACQSLYLGYKLIARNLLLFFGLLVIHSPADVTRFYWVYDLSLTLVVLFYFPARKVHWRELFSQKNKCQTSLRQSLPYAAIDDLSIVYSRADQVIIERLLDSASLGIYSAAYRFVDAFNLLPQALFHNLFPLAAKKGGLTRRQIAKMVAVMSLFGLCIGVVLYTFSNWLTVFLLGEAYAPAGELLRYFVPVILMFFFNAPLNTVLQSSDQVSAYIPWLLISTVLNLLLNIIFIPIFGLLGSVYAMMVGELFLLVVNVCLVLQQTKSH